MNTSAMPQPPRAAILSIMMLALAWSARSAENGPPSLLPLRADDALRPAIEKSIRVKYVLRDTRDTTLVQVMVQVDHSPTDMAFDMALRVGDQTWPLGPVAWRKGKTDWWAYDTDLPENIKEVDVVLVPSAPAAAKLKRQDPFQRAKDLTEIWSGEPIILPGIKVREQRIEMHSLPLSAQTLREEAMERLDEADPVARQAKLDGDLAKARAELQRTLRDHPDDARSLYNLGCLWIADGDLASAMKSLVEARRRNPDAALSQKVQRQLRTICEAYVQRVKTGDVPATCALGEACEHGWGVKQDAQEAKRLYRNAGNAGNADAMFRLAAMYEHETGATEHTEKSHEWYRAQTLEWYRKAAELGNSEAKQWLAVHDQH